MHLHSHKILFPNSCHHSINTPWNVPKKIMNASSEKSELLCAFHKLSNAAYKKLALSKYQQCQLCSLYYSKLALSKYVPIMLALQFMLFKASIIKISIMLALQFIFFKASIIKVPIMHTIRKCSKMNGQKYIPNFAFQ